MKKFKVLIKMMVGNVHYHEFQLEAENEYEIFESIKNKEWFHYERTNADTKVHKEFIQVKSIADISIVEI